MLGNRKHRSVEGAKSVIRDTCTLVWTWIVIHDGRFKNFTIPIFPEAELVEILNTVDIHHRRLYCSRSCGSRHMRRTSTAVAVERSDQLGELVSLSLRICLRYANHLRLLSDGVLLPHDKDQPHTTHQPRNLLQNFSSRTLNNPPHRLDLAPGLCSHAFKKHLLGHCSIHDEDVQYAAIT